jgi:hypothetical protein
MVRELKLTPVGVYKGVYNGHCIIDEIINSGESAKTDSAQAILQRLENERSRMVNKEESREVLIDPATSIRDVIDAVRCFHSRWHRRKYIGPFGDVEDQARVYAKFHLGVPSITIGSDLKFNC